MLVADDLTNDRGGELYPQSATMPTTLRGRFNPPAISTVAAPIDTPYSKIFVSAPKRPTA